MKRLYWIARAAWYMRSIFGWWKPKDLAFCWETGAVVYDNFEHDDRLNEIGGPADEMSEELSCWND